MRVRVGFVFVLLVSSLALAGCASSPDAAAPAEETVQFDVVATSTTGVIRGVVIDEAIRPLSGVTINLTSLARGTTSNDEGAFSFSDLEPGTYFLQVSKRAFTSIQTSVEVVAGVDEPPIVKVSLQSIPSEQPYVVGQTFDSFITCGAAIVATSVGCNTFGFVGEALGDRVYFRMEFEVLPTWTQGDLVWDQTQPAGGAMIWEIVDPNYPGSPQPHTGYRETGPSPALAYINTTLLKENEEWVVGEGNGVLYRIFAGPHPTCTGVGFGCGVTINQRLTAYVHNFYNFAPDEGWRFFYDGEHPLPN